MSGPLSAPALASPATRAPDTAALGRTATRDNLEAAGTKFESIFIGMMLDSMRKAKLGDGLFENKATEQFRDMQDKQLAESMAKTTPIGIGRAVVDFLARAHPLPVDPAAGGTPDQKAPGT